MDAFPAPCYDPHAPADGGWGGLCSGWYGPDNLEVVDSVRVPADLPAGKYVVQWSAQQVSSLTLVVGLWPCCYNRLNFGKTEKTAPNGGKRETTGEKRLSEERVCRPLTL